MELKYINENKTKGQYGWILDLEYLTSIQDKFENKRHELDLEDIELVLLIANKEEHLLD